MNWVNTVSNQFYFGQTQPTGSDWRNVPTEEFNALLASGWDPTAYTPPHRVSKDTITTRVLDAGKLTDLITLISTLSTEQQFLWSNYAWFWSNNATIIGMCQQLQLDPSVILAKDPYIS